MGQADYQLILPLPWGALGSRNNFAVFSAQVAAIWEYWQ